MLRAERIRARQIPVTIDIMMTFLKGLKFDRLKLVTA
jgi:hypothetical protein